MYESESTIENLDSFLQSLATFPKLRTIKLSLHHDLQMYEKDSQFKYGFDLIIDPIWSGKSKEYEHDTASVLQYLSTIKKINDRGRFSLVSSDCGETYHSTPRDYYGLCHTELVHGSGLWTPVWTWNDRLSWVQSVVSGAEVVDIEQCRMLFEELRKARIPVSVELEPVNVTFGAFFASCWDDKIPRRHYDNARGPITLPGGITIPRELAKKPKQHFLQQKILTSTTSKDLWSYHGVCKGIDHQHVQTISDNFPSAGMIKSVDDRPVQTVSDSFPSAIDDHDDSDELDNRQLADLTPLQIAAALDRDSYSDDDSLGLDRGPPADLTPSQLDCLDQKQRRSTGTSNAKSHVDPAAPNEADTKPDIPDPVWRLNEIGDLVDDLRLTWHRGFAYVYTWSFGEHCHPINSDGAERSKLIHKCQTHLRARLWREAEFTALLFRRIPVDFPRLTRLALYIPAALYPDHDQTFIDRALPGTGWTVAHHGRVGGALPILNLDEACLRLADDMCPFVQRVFTRSAPTEDPGQVVGHGEEWHRTKRPLFDLDGGYKSMEQLLTEPLGENYTEGGN